ncbi:hypothetical protein [Egbenema bharatensis]|uniref:hypothetical protein n=1 Tax=Egbenema bharatensis TaxID=3463334 RepID=UPI003A8601F2
MSPSEIASLLIVLVILSVLLWLFFSAGKPAARRRRRRKSSRPFQEPVRPTGNVRGSTQRRLMLLLHDDRRAAERLLTQVRLKYPGKSETWYWEKVIFDLERDRYGV